MLDIDVRADFTPALRFVGSVQRQIPYATALAINDTLVGAQKEIRQGLHRRFDLRRKKFIERTIKINRKDFAKKTKLEGTLRVDPRRPVLAKHERGGIQRPEGQHFAVPTGTKKKRTRRFPTLKKRYGPFRRRGGQILGAEERTFIIATGRAPGLYKRVGKGKRSRVRQLYAFKRRVSLDARLDFIATAGRVVHRDYAQNFHRKLEYAMRTSK